MNIPKKLFGIDGKKALERILKEEASKPWEKPEGITAATQEDLSSYISLEMPQPPHLLVAKHRLGYSLAVEKAVKDVGITVQNTAQEQDGTPYIENITWESALKLTDKLGGRTLNLQQYKSFRDLVYHGAQKIKNVYDGNGELISPKECMQIINEIQEKRKPWRSEWLDAKFMHKQGMLYLETDHDQNLLAKKLIPLPQGSFPSENSWCDETSFSIAGLPTQKSPVQEYRQGENLYFGTPRDGRVAWFWVYTDGAYLYCDEGPQYSGSGLGVRLARARVI